MNENIFKKNQKLLFAPKLTTNLNDLFDSPDYEKLRLGKLKLPSGHLVIGDPLAHLGTALSCHLTEQIVPGEYDVELAVFHHQKYGTRYMAARIKFAAQSCITHREAQCYGHNEGCGFPVDAGMAALCDATSEFDFYQFLHTWHYNNPQANHYDDYFLELLVANYQEHPEMQTMSGDWLNWNIPACEGNVIMFSSGLGNGRYKFYWGYDVFGQIAELVLLFIDPSIFEIVSRPNIFTEANFNAQQNFRQLVPNNQVCFATDRVIIDGFPVEYMYREEPQKDLPDSGWRFFAGDEIIEFRENSDNIGLYMLNTVANHDKMILPFLTSPIGSAFYRGKDGNFHQVTSKTKRGFNK